MTTEAPFADLYTAAEYIVALAAADKTKGLVSAALARKGLQGVYDKHRDKVDRLWEKAHKEAQDYVLLVLGNNPSKTKEQVLARTDVQSALRWPYEQAAKASAKILRQAWAEAETETVKKVKGEFVLYKEAWSGYDLTEALLDDLLDDLAKNAKAMRERYREILTSDNYSKDRLESLGRGVRQRATMSLGQAVWGVSSEIRASAFEKAGLLKMWVAVLDKKTCGHCKANHGKVLKPHEDFSSTYKGVPTLGVYRGSLLGPPRHPWCRCILVIAKPPKKIQKS